MDTNEMREIVEAAMDKGRDDPRTIDFDRTFRPAVVKGLLDRIEALEASNRYKYGDGYEAAGITVARLSAMENGRADPAMLEELE
jgi:hypothetical protein